MEVICDRCGAEYEFEDTLVSSGGTTVKCTSCGHLFKVKKGKSDASAGGSSSTAQPWSVQHADGRTTDYDSLKQVTQAIRARELQADDRLSRTGRVFRRLGDIAELRPFFSNSAPPSRSGAADSTTPTATKRSPAGPPPPRTRPRRVTPAPMAPTPLPSPSWQAPEPAKERAKAESHENPATPTHEPEESAAVATPDSVARPDDLDAALFSAQHSRTQRWLLPLLALLVTIGAAAALLLWDASEAKRRARTLTPAKPEAPSADTAKAVERGDRLLELHDTSRFSEAIGAYMGALARVPNDAHLLSSVSRAHARWSQALLFELDDLRAGVHPHPDEAAVLEAEQQTHASAAKDFASRAARKNPGNEEAEVALADALRLTGNLVGARLEVDRAFAHQSQPEAETLRVAALLAVAEAGGDLSAGAPLSERALASDDCGAACRVVRLRVLLAMGEADHAARVLSELEREFPLLPQLPRLRARVDAVRAMSPGGDGGAQEPAEAAQGPGEKDELPQPALSDSQLAEANALCAEGEERLEQGATPAADRHFKQALRIAPDFPRAEVGLGYVALERGAIRAALSHFRAAAARSYPEAYIGLGETYRALDRPAAAIRAYRTYLSRYPKNRAASIARQQLEVLTMSQDPEPPSEIP